MITTLLCANTANAEGAFHPSRVRLLIHGGVDIGEKSQLQLDFIPAGNLLGEVAPLTHLGVNIEPVKGLGVKPVIGWAFGNDEPILAIQLSPVFADRIYGWGDVELQLPSQSGYWFAQADYELTDHIHAGVEGEGWGLFSDGSSWSNGGGVNLLGRFDKTGIDLAGHIRNLDGSTKPELVVRVHLFL
ncbi:MAG: hypothetical protein V1664_00045 [Candidatus Uhrbacteria bacterium]